MRIKANYALLPSGSIEVEDELAAVNYSEAERSKFISNTGFSRLTRASGRSLSDLVLEGLAQIERDSPDLFKDVGTVLVVSQTFDKRIPNVSALIQKKFSLRSDTLCIDIVDGCNGFIKALSILALMHERESKGALVVCGDLNSIITEGSEPGTRLLFGDGFGISFLEHGTKPSVSEIYTDGDSSGVISCGFDSNALEMNGFEVFRFTRKSVPAIVSKFLNHTGLALEDFDLVGLHQASALVVKEIARSLQLDGHGRGDFLCGRIGNLGSGSIPAWLAGLDLPLNQLYSLLAVGYGAGLSIGVATLEVRLEQKGLIYV